MEQRGWAQVEIAELERSDYEDNIYMDYVTSFEDEHGISSSCYGRPKHFRTVAEDDAMKAVIQELKDRLNKMSEPPEVCPVTNRPYFCTLAHPELGEVATYGGPFDSYTIPAWSIEDQEFRSERYDHDEGGWVEGGEPYGIALISTDKLCLMQDTFDDYSALLQDFAKTLKPLLEEVKARYGHMYEENDWNPEYEFSLNLRIREFREIKNLADMALNALQKGGER